MNYYNTNLNSECNDFKIQFEILKFMHIDEDTSIKHKYPVDENNKEVPNAFWDEVLQVYTKDGIILKYKSFESTKQRLARSENDFKALLKREYTENSNADFSILKEQLLQKMEQNLINLDLSLQNNTAISNYLKFQKWLMSASSYDLNEVLEN